MTGESRSSEGQFLPQKERPFRIAVLISGGGTTLRNLIEYRQSGKLHAEIAVVISSTDEAKGLGFAEQESIPARVVPFRRFASPHAMGEEVFAICREFGVDLVVMGGFLRQAEIPSDFENRVINIHPSLIPAFCGKGMYGRRVHEAVLAAAAPVTGCTVHFVDNEFDHGPVIAQRSVDVLPGDSPEQLASRVFKEECRLYPEVINAIAAGVVGVVGDEVVFAPNAGRLL